MTRTTAHPDWASLDLPRPRGAMPLVGEWMTPWIAAAFLVAVLTVTYVVGGNQLPLLEQTLLAIGLCATLTAAVLVVLRSNRMKQVSVREERARPPAEALAGPVGGHVGDNAYVQGMQTWTAAIVELLEHAHGCAEEGSVHASELEAALADTRDLRELLAESRSDTLSLHDAATIHALCTLWEANQDRIEQLAASSDPQWYRRWRGRTVADRQLRHGAALTTPMVIPYRS